MDHSKDLKKFCLALVGICLIYLVSRLAFPETIEFGYDQPRTADVVASFIENGKLFETQRFAIKAPWGNISWGPAVFYFYTPFLLLSRHPLIISYMIALFNIVSIIGISYIGYRYISRNVGLFAGLILATQPWWMIFSRMIYQPTPVVPLIVISMLLFLVALSKPKSIALSLMVFSWVFMIETYFHTASFVLASALLILIFKRKTLFNRYLLLGFALSTLLIIPFFINFSKVDYLPINTSPDAEKYQYGRDDPISRVKSIVPGYFKVISGGSMEYQLGYGMDDFYNSYPYLKWGEKIAIIFMLIVVLYNLVCVIATSYLRKIRLVFLVWALVPILFLVFIPLPSVPPIPRYFLISLPSIAILSGFLFTEISKHSKIYLFLLILPIYWLYFIYCYSIFIRDFNYEDGHLSVYSDTQYLFLEKAIKSAMYHNKLKHREDFVLSSDETNPQEFALDGAARFTLMNVFDINFDKQRDNPGYYILDYSLYKVDPSFTKIGRFGPYTLYEYVANSFYGT